MKLSLLSEYFDWLCTTIKAPTDRYLKLMLELYNTPFDYVVWQDENIYSYGIELRYQFGAEKGIQEAAIACLLDTSSCNLLEMMVALSQQMETIMEEIPKGNRTKTWFWKMIQSLGLDKQTDHSFDEDYVRYVLGVFMSRHYQPNGAGGLFTFKNPPRDVRQVDIWMQAMWWLDENYQQHL